MLAVLLDNIRSIHNVGSVFRTSSGAGVSEIALAGITPTPGDLRLNKTALGAEMEIPWVYFETQYEAVDYYKLRGFKIISIEQTPKSISIDAHKFSSEEKIVFVFGNEINGVSKEFLDNSDIILDIPMLGKKNSLNVSVTAGVVLYQYLFNIGANESKDNKRFFEK